MLSPGADDVGTRTWMMLIATGVETQPYTFPSSLSSGYCSQTHSESLFSIQRNTVWIAEQVQTKIQNQLFLVSVLDKRTFTCNQTRRIAGKNLHSGWMTTVLLLNTRWSLKLGLHTPSLDKRHSTWNSNFLVVVGQKLINS